MALDFSEGFESGSNGATITSGNTSFNGGVVGAAATFDNTQVAHGSLSCKFVTSSNTSVLQRTFTAGNQRTMRRYVRLAALPASGPLILHVVKLGAAAATATMRVSQSGNVVIRDGNTTVATTGGAVPINAWWRYEWQIDGVGATQNIKVFVPPNQDGNTPDMNVSGSYTGGNFDTSNSGPNTSGSFTVWMDDAYEDSALITIGSAAPPLGSIFTFQHVVSIGS